MIYLIDLESIESRYTCEWKTHIPELLSKHNLPLTVISGPDDLPENNVPGAFLNFGATNVYKAVQLEKISRLFCANAVHDGDYFLFTDAWNPAILNVKYMASLLNINIKIGAMWHAGNYDKHDFLGRLGHVPWINYTEKALFDAIDHNYFATEFHTFMFMDNVLDGELSTEGKLIKTGWPMDYMAHRVASADIKEDTIVFPHRIAPEKQVDIFKDLASEMPEYNWVVCQEQQLAKAEYHRLLAKSKIVFSASLQETLGISIGLEGPLAGCIPLAPDRLSYSEIFKKYPDFLYPSEWTENWDLYLLNKDSIINKIKHAMSQYDSLTSVINDYTNNTLPKYFHADELLEVLKECQPQ